MAVDDTEPERRAESPSRDLEDRDDVERVVRAFYGRAMVDPLIGYLFTDVARMDLDAHLPVMVDFWQTMLMGAGLYHGGAFPVHQRIHALEPLRAEHFDRWLALWSETLDEHFTGERVELAKAHATRVARAFHWRLTGSPPPLVQLEPTPET